MISILPVAGFERWISWIGIYHSAKATTIESKAFTRQNVIAFEASKRK